MKKNIKYLIMTLMIIFIGMSGVSALTLNPEIKDPIYGKTFGVKCWSDETPETNDECTSFEWNTCISFPNTEDYKNYLYTLYPTDNFLFEDHVFKEEVKKGETSRFNETFAFVDVYKCNKSVKKEDLNKGPYNSTSCVENFDSSHWEYTNSSSGANVICSMVPCSKIEICSYNNGDNTDVYPIICDHYTYVGDTKVCNDNGGKEPYVPTDPDGLGEGTSGCDILGTKTLGMIKWVSNIIRFGIPVIIILLGIKDFVMVIISGDDKNYKEAFNKLIKRLIIGVVILLIPYLIKFLFNLGGIIGLYNIGEDEIFCGIV